MHLNIIIGLGLTDLWRQH